MMSFEWSESTGAILARMNGEGAGAGDIAAAIGEGCTRGAVLKQIHLLSSAPVPVAAPIEQKLAEPTPPPRLRPVGRFAANGTSDWTDERIVILKRMWADGRSASDIACELDCGLSRNAVIGKVHRLGLTGPNDRPRRTYASPRAAARARPGNVPPRGPSTRAFNPHVARPVRQPVVEEVLEAPVSQMLTLEQLSEQTCKFPSGDPLQEGFGFCGAKAAGGPYCRYHHRLAYVPATQRVRTIARMEAVAW